MKKRDEIYTNLLKDFYSIYVDRQKEKEKYKWKFYKLTTKGMIFVAIMLNLFLIFLTLKVDVAHISDVVVPVVVAIISLISAFIAIPTIISKYLFNPQEDSQVIDMIKSIQEKDLENRGRYDE